MEKEWKKEKKTKQNGKKKEKKKNTTNYCARELGSWLKRLEFDVVFQ